jgi:hypothetical protein
LVLEQIRLIFWVQREAMLPWSPAGADDGAKANLTLDAIAGGREYLQWHQKIPAWPRLRRRSATGSRISLRLPSE